MFQGAANAQISEVLSHLCRPYRIASPWGSLRVSGDVRKCPRDAGGALHPQAKAFPPAALARSGVARKKDIEQSSSTVL
jgi:hypothetical protein